MNGVEIPAERKFNLRLGRVNLNSVGFLGAGRGRENQRGQSREGPRGGIGTENRRREWILRIIGV